MIKDDHVKEGEFPKELLPKANAEVDRILDMLQKPVPTTKKSNSCKVLKLPLK